MFKKLKTRNSSFQIYWKSWGFSWTQYVSEILPHPEGVEDVAVLDNFVIVGPLQFRFYTKAYGV